jgi:hypothetical protein
MLQCDEMLERLKTTNNRATQNVLKREQSFIEYTLIFITPSPTPNSPPNN